MDTFTTVMDLPANEFHIWRASLDRHDTPLDTLLAFLSSDERARADRYHFELDRRRFVSSRALLRLILGRYLDLGPSRVQFGYGSHGKPYLLEEAGRTGISFNAADSNELALYAFSRQPNIGVDVEHIRELSDAQQIASSFFSMGENAEWLRLPSSQKTQGFFNCWTRKEAFIKAIGEGLSYPLSEFEVSLTPGEPPRLRSIAGSIENASRWSLWALSPEAGYVGALAAPIPESQKDRFQLRMLQAPLL
jgi:4'-phosphopantetheinyl transferase